MCVYKYTCTHIHVYTYVKSYVVSEDFHLINRANHIIPDRPSGHIRIRPYHIHIQYVYIYIYIYGWSRARVPGCYPPPPPQYPPLPRAVCDNSHRDRAGWGHDLRDSPRFRLSENGIDIAMSNRQLSLRLGFLVSRFPDSRKFSPCGATSSRTWHRTHHPNHRGEEASGVCNAPRVHQSDGYTTATEASSATENRENRKI